MTRRWRIGWRYAALTLAGGSLLQAGCARIIGQELEVLFAAAGSPALVGASRLADFFGPQILRFFN